jgi:hypothetical protein
VQKAAPPPAPSPAPAVPPAATASKPATPPPANPAPIAANKPALPPPTTPASTSPPQIATPKPDPTRSRPAPVSPARRPVRPAPGRVATAAPAPRPSGRDDVFEQDAKPAAAAGGDDCSITLGSKPWSEVWIDGKSTGKMTPLVDYKVSCGRHKITFKNPEIPVEKSETITVRSGDKFKKVVRLVDTGE